MPNSSKLLVQFKARNVHNAWLGNKVKVVEIEGVDWGEADNVVQA